MFEKSRIAYHFLMAKKSSDAYDFDSKRSHLHDVLSLVDKLHLRLGEMAYRRDVRQRAHFGLEYGCGN